MNREKTAGKLTIPFSGHIRDMQNSMTRRKESEQDKVDLILLTLSVAGRINMSRTRSLASFGIRVLRTPYEYD